MKQCHNETAHRTPNVDSERLLGIIPRNCKWVWQDGGDMSRPWTPQGIRELLPPMWVLADWKRWNEPITETGGADIQLPGKIKEIKGEKAKANGHSMEEWKQKRMSVVVKKKAGIKAKRSYSSYYALQFLPTFAGQYLAVKHHDK